MLSNLRLELREVAQIVFLILPVLLAGITFFILRRNKLTEVLNFPLDCYLKVNNKRLFGQNKTVKGPVLMGLFTMLYGLVLYGFFKDFLDGNFSVSGMAIFFFTVGVVYCLGELPNSFVKRQLMIPPGESPRAGAKRYFFILADTFDSILAIVPLYLFFFGIKVKVAFYAFFVGGIIHFLTDVLLKKIKVK